MSISVGVIGYGMGSYHCKFYEANPRSDLVAICDLDAARLERAGAQYPKAHLYTQYEDMFAKEKLDAVSVALPNSCDLKSKREELRLMGEKYLKRWGIDVA